MSRRYLLQYAVACALVILLINLVRGQATGSLAGTVKDPAGAVVGGAQVTLRDAASGQSRGVTSDDVGRFRIENLTPGQYTISVSRGGFKIAEREVEIAAGRATTLEIKLEIEAPRAEIGVSAKGAVAANAEPTYRRLRDGTGFETYAVTNLTITRDVGTLTLKSGRISFLEPVPGRVVKAIFAGDGEFLLK